MIDKIIQIINNPDRIIYALTEGGNIYCLQPKNDKSGGGDWELATKSPMLKEEEWDASKEEWDASKDRGGELK